MATVFNAFEKTPGVYIQEILVPGPIKGVGTSTAVFIGPARQGPINDPTSLTNWTQFKDAFGLSDDFGPYFPTGGVYAPHAVRGFFDNGGSHCYFVRVGTAARASRGLNDRAAVAKPVLLVTAKTEGVANNAITVEVQDANIVAAVPATRATSNLVAAGNNQATVPAPADAAKFRPGDIVALNEAAKNDRATIASISGTTITFEGNLTNNYGGGTIRIADLVAGQTKVRIADTTGIEPGSYVNINNGANNENGVVQSVEATNKFLTLTTGLTNVYPMGAADPAWTSLWPIRQRQPRLSTTCPPFWRLLRFKAEKTTTFRSSPRWSIRMRSPHWKKLTT